MLKNLILTTISLLIVLSSCCKLRHGEGSLPPEWETRIPTGNSKFIFYDGLKTLPKYKDVIIAHTTIYDGGFNFEDNRLCAVSLKTGLVEWHFPANLEERHYCHFGGEGYLYKNKLVFQYKKDARTYSSRAFHTTCCFDLDKKEVLWEIERKSGYSFPINMDIIGKEEACYFVQDSSIVCSVDLETGVRTDIYTDPELKINYLSFGSDDRLLLFCYEEDGLFDFIAYVKILDLRTNNIIYSRRLTPDNVDMRITNIPAWGFEKNGILYANLDRYLAAIDINSDRLLWGRADYWAYTPIGILEHSGVLLKCGGNATTGYDAKTGAVLYNYDNYGSTYASQDGRYAYLLSRKGVIDVIDIKSGAKLDFIKCKYSDRGESFFGSCPTIHDGKMYVMSDNHLFRYPVYPW